MSLEEALAELAARARPPASPRKTAAKPMNRRKAQRQARKRQRNR